MSVWQNGLDVTRVPLWKWHGQSCVSQGICVHMCNPINKYARAIGLVYLKRLNPPSSQEFGTQGRFRSYISSFFVSFHFKHLYSAHLVYWFPRYSTIYKSTCTILASARVQSNQYLSLHTLSLNIMEQKKQDWRKRGKLNWPGWTTVRGEMSLS